MNPVSLLIVGIWRFLQASESAEKGVEDPYGIDAMWKFMVQTIRGIILLAALGIIVVIGFFCIYLPFFSK